MADPVAELDRLPLHRTPARADVREPVTFFYDAAPEPGSLPDTEIRDQPGPHRHFTGRPVWERQRLLPDADDAGRGTDWLTALTAYREAAAV